MAKVNSLRILCLLTAALLLFSDAAFSQKWKKKKSETLYARNKKKQTSPIYVGIGVKDATAQLHTVGSVRHEGLTVNNNLNSILAIDGSGNLYWRDISNSLANAWFLSGNTASAANFFGTNNNEDIRIRTNNVQRAVITSSGSIGIGVATPSAQLHTTGSVRFQGLTNDNSQTRLMTIDNTGNVFWKDVASIGSNAWNLDGNIANANHFLGSTNAEDLRFRVNNIQRAVITTTGNLGLGTLLPTAQLHTSGTVRFEGIASNNTAQRLAVTDNNGNIFYRDLASLQNQFWSLAGNTGVNPASSFLGTLDNNRLAFRTNNTEKMSILPNGNIGIGTTSPATMLHVTNGSTGITGFPYEAAVFEKSGDTKLTVLSSDNSAVGGAAVVLGHSNFLVGGQYPAFEMQYGINNGRYLRFNYLLRNSSGVIQSAVPNILIMSDNSRVGINLGPTDGALTPNYPTANFHTNGTVRLQGLATGTGTPLVADANGNIFLSSGSASGGWSLTGNAATNPATNFLGTTDNIRLVFRTSNTEQLTILPDGRVGINTATPASRLVVNSTIPDNHIRLLGVASSLFFEGAGVNTEARVGYATQPNNFVNGSSPGDLVVQALGASSSVIFGTTGGGAGNGVERARVSPAGFFGIATQSPTATLHTNGTVRFQNLPTGTGSALVMDANGNVFRSTTLTGRPETELEELKTEIATLRKELEELRQITSSLRSGTVSIQSAAEAILFQNTPNPFNKTTVIRYYIPENTRSAQLQILDMNGQLLQTTSLNGKGNQNLSIDGGRLSPGTYQYILYVDGRRIDAKKMILTE